MPVHYPGIYCYTPVWALPLSLATTYGITVVFSSCRYLDVSVPCVSLHTTMYSWHGTCEFTTGGFPHSEIHESMAICASSWLIAAYRVLLRLLVPRHSPYALNSLTFRYHDLSIVLSFLVLLKWLSFTINYDLALLRVLILRVTLYLSRGGMCDVGGGIPVGLRSPSLILTSHFSSLTSLWYFVTLLFYCIVTYNVFSSYLIYTSKHKLVFMFETYYII
jgi:hypothetical protein